MAASGYFEQAYALALAIGGLAASMLAASMSLAGAGPRAADGAKAAAEPCAGRTRALPPALLSL